MQQQQQPKKKKQKKKKKKKKKKIILFKDYQIQLYSLLKILLFLLFPSPFLPLAHIITMRLV